MSVTKRQGSRNSFASTLPVLLPLYDSVSETWQFSPDEEVICGAASECQFHLNYDGIADRHCLFRFRSGALTIGRLEGRIWLNEIPVSSEAILTAGDIVSIGPVTIRVDEVPRPAETSSSNNSVTASVPAFVRQQEPVAAPVMNVHHQIYPAVPVPASLPYHFAPALQLSPPPLPASFFDNQSAKISAAAESLLRERNAEFESRERVLQAREQQLQELELLIRDRERICMDRQATLDERGQVLAETKNYLEEQRAQSEAVREQLNQHRLDLERRMRQLTEREDDLARQLESSAQGYVQIEQTRGELSARLSDIQQRETQLSVHRQELEELASWINAQKDELQASSTAVEYRAAELNSKETALRDTEADLAERQQSLAATESSLREREHRLTLAEQRATEASLHLSAADERSQAADRRAAEAEACRIAAEEKLHHAEQKLQEVAEQLCQLEAARNEVNGRQSDVEAIELESQARTVQLQQLELQLNARAVEVEQMGSRLVAAQQELDAQREALSLQLATIDEKACELEQRTGQLDQREAELSSRVAQLAEEPSGGTRSVEQLMAIAAERESAIRSRQEAARAMEELKAMKAAIADKESALQARDQELESRSAELADRLSKLKQERDALVAKERQLNEAPARPAVDPTTLHDEHQRLLERQAALTGREARAAERENAANVVLRNAEAEREALQMSHKDLICERNALMQLSQDLNSRASGLTERESIVAQQTEELRSRFHAMNQQSSELQRLENELNLRAAELHRRVTQFKSELRDNKLSVAENDAEKGSAEESNAADVITVIGSTREQDLSEALQAAESQLSGLQSERDALLTAVRELQRAMMDARQDVEEANRLRTDAAKQEQTLAALYQTIEERSGQLQLLESRLRQSESHTEALEKQLQSYSAGGAPIEESIERTVLNLGNGTADSGEVEAELMRQLEALKEELKSARDVAAPVKDAAATIEELKQRIEELRERNEALEARIAELSSGPENRNSVVSMVELDELEAQLTRATEVISDRDDLIRELRMRLSQQADAAGESPAGASLDAAQLQNEARELDRRASLLDAREEEVRERLRMVSNAEEEVENQRRQLLDARQQLELARTEIQVAMKQHSAAASYSAPTDTDFRKINEDVAVGAIERPGAAIFGMEAEPITTTLDDSDGDSANAALDLRAELASLFGLSGRSAEKPMMELPPQEDVPDTSEPLGTAKPVAFHFGEDASRIVAGHVEEVTPESTSDTSSDESSDDFVRDYMEQLLSRSRKAAGNSLPSELSGGNKGKAAPAASSAKKPEPTPVKGPPKVKSYIDQYMAGGSLGLEGDSAAAQAEPQTELADEDATEAPIVPRVKVDVEKLRQNMDSFRSVSTQSVEKALVTHALKTERLSINGRIFLVCVMGFLSVFFGIANYKGIINYPALIWVTLVGAIGAGLELMRKLCAIKAKGKALTRCEESYSAKSTGSTKPETSEIAVPATSAKSKEPVPPPLPMTAPGQDGSGESSASIASAYSAIAAVTAAEDLNPLAVGTSSGNNDEEGDKDEYFEL